MNEPNRSVRRGAPRTSNRSLGFNDQNEDLAASMPLSLAGVFDEAFDLYKRHGRTLALIVCTAVIPIELIRHTVYTFWLGPLTAHIAGLANPDPAAVMESGTGTLLLGTPNSPYPGIISLLVTVLMSGAIAIAVSDIYLGREPSARSAWRRSLPYLPRMVAGYFFGLLCNAAVAVMCGLVDVFLIFLITMSGFPIAAGIIGTIFGVVLTALGVAMMSAWGFILITPLTVLEGLSPGAAVGRNARLVGTSRLIRTTAACLGLGFLVFGLETLMHKAISASLPALQLSDTVAFLVQTGYDTAIHLFFAPYWMVFVTLLYYDFRVRREGFDVRAPRKPKAARQHQSDQSGLAPPMGSSYKMPESSEEKEAALL